jgi:hypothetical protein
MDGPKNFIVKNVQPDSCSKKLLISRKLDGHQFTPTGHAGGANVSFK